MASEGRGDPGDEAEKRRSTIGFSINDPVRVLVVGNDHEYEQILRTTLGRLRLSTNVEAAFLHSVADARRAVDRARIDAIVADIILPDGTSAELFDAVQSNSPDATRIAVAAKDEETAPHASPSGAREVWQRTQDPFEVRKQVERLIQVRRLSRVHHRAP